MHIPAGITNEAAGALWRVSLFLAIHSSEMTQGRKTRDLLVASAAAPPVQSSKKCQLIRYELLDECFTILLFHQWKTSKLSIPLLRARLGDVRIGASSLRSDKLVAPAGSREQREPKGVQNDKGTGCAVLLLNQPFNRRDRKNKNIWIAPEETEIQQPGEHAVTG